MIFETYWIIAQNGDFWLPKRLKNGLHLVEVSLGKEVTIKPLGAVRGKAITPNRWESLRKAPYTGQSFGEALMTLRGKDNDKKEKGGTSATHSGQCEIPQLASSAVGERTVEARPSASRTRKVSRKQRR